MGLPASGFTCRGIRYTQFVEAVILAGFTDHVKNKNLFEFATKYQVH